MTSKQYEELCRHFLAELFHLGLDQVQSPTIANPWRLAFPGYAHQIDLYWEIETEAARYLHIANAKWRTPPEYVTLEDVLLLQQVKTKVGAHKAVLLTNTGFTDGTLAAALDEGIALYLLRAEFDCRRLHVSDPIIIQSQLQSLARVYPTRPLYSHQLLRKAFPPLQNTAASAQSTAAALPAVFSRQTPSGSAASAPLGQGGRSFGYLTKQGLPPGFVKK